MTALLLAISLLLAPQAEIGTALIGGKATWYDVGNGHYAAAGPVLRDALGGDPAFRGQRVTVCSGERCTTVVLSDWCLCRDRNGEPTLLDLSADAFRDLAPLSAGVINVEIELGGPIPTLPPTDLEVPSGGDDGRQARSLDRVDALPRYRPL